MIVTTEKRTEKAVGLMEDIEYGFENGPHMMQLLSNMYSNPVEAMVREYLTNMYDAHIALFRATGSWGEEPVLTLPTSLDLTLVFADRGIGMSAESVKTIYTRYGRSTKSQSNEEVGGFGLGAKVGFAYNGGVDWSVESRFGGEKHTFIARIGVNGMPVLSHIAADKCKVSNTGTSVTIPVRREDVNAIREAAAKYLRYFPIPIKVVNGVGLPTPRKISLKNESWSISGASYHDNGLVVIVGNVPYEVADNEYVAILATAGMNGKYFWRNNEIVLHVPVGSVDIVPSRDNLMYTTKTRNSIANAIKKCNSEIVNVASKITEDCDTEYDALVMMLSFTSLSYIEDVLEYVMYRGKKVMRGQGITRKVSDFANTTFEAWGITNTNSAEIVAVDCTSEVSLTAGENTMLLINDDAKALQKVAKSLAHERLVSKTGSGRASRWGRHKEGHILIATTSLTPAELSKKFGGYPTELISKVSEHKKIRAAKGSGVTLGPIGVYKFNGSSWSARVVVPVDKEVRYYLPLTKGQSRFTYKDDSVAARRLTKSGVESKLLDTGYTLYGIKQDEVTSYDSALWVNLEEAIAKQIVAKINAIDAEYAPYLATERVITTRHDRLEAPLAALPPHPLFNAYKEKWSVEKKNLTKVAVLAQEIEGVREIPMVKDALAALPTLVGNSLNEMLESLVKRYPMVFALINAVPVYGRYGNDTSVVTHLVEITEYLAERDARSTP